MWNMKEVHFVTWNVSHSGSQDSEFGSQNEVDWLWTGNDYCWLFTDEGTMTDMEAYFLFVPHNLERSNIRNTCSNYRIETLWPHFFHHAVGHDVAAHTHQCQLVSGKQQCNNLQCCFYLLGRFTICRHSPPDTPRTETRDSSCYINES